MESIQSVPFLTLSLFGQNVLAMTGYFDLERDTTKAGLLGHGN